MKRVGSKKMAFDGVPLAEPAAIEHVMPMRETFAASALTDFASDFSALMMHAQTRELSPHAKAQFDMWLTKFDELLADMKVAAAGVREALDVKH